MNTKFGKLEDNKLIYAPYCIVDGEKHIYTNDPAVMLKYGYKRIIKTAYPEDEKSYRETYVEDAETITIIWKEVEI